MSKLLVAHRHLPTSNSELIVGFCHLSTVVSELIVGLYHLSTAMSEFFSPHQAELTGFEQLDMPQRTLFDRLKSSTEDLVSKVMLATDHSNSLEFSMIGHCKNTAKIKWLSLCAVWKSA